MFTVIARNDEGLTLLENIYACLCWLDAHTIVYNPRKQFYPHLLASAKRGEAAWKEILRGLALATAGAPVCKEFLLAACKGYAQHELHNSAFSRFNPVLRGLPAPVCSEHVTCGQGLSELYISERVGQFLKPSAPQEAEIVAALKVSLSNWELTPEMRLQLVHHLSECPCST